MRHQRFTGLAIMIPVVRAAVVVALGVVSVVSVGCGPDKSIQLRRDLQETQEKASKLEHQLADEQATVRSLQDRVATARGLNPDELKQLAVPVRIQLASQSGGYTEGDKPGHVGVVLYIQPIDQDGDVVKAIGSLRVTLLDLTEPTSPQVFATYDFDVPTMKTLWYGRLMTNHFTVRCPWPPGEAPTFNRITAVVEFTDLLTGRVLTIEPQTFEIKPRLRSSD